MPVNLWTYIHIQRVEKPPYLVLNPSSDLASMIIQMGNRAIMTLFGPGPRANRFCVSTCKEKIRAVTASVNAVTILPFCLALGSFFNFIMILYSRGEIKRFSGAWITLIIMAGNIIYAQAE